jgi:hypothetical protein
MKKIYIFLIFLFLSQTLLAGVHEYFVYDKRDRYDLDKLDCIVKVRINGYHAFADPGLIRTVVEERKQIASRSKKPFKMGGRGSRKGNEMIFSSIPGMNETLQMLRNTLWVVDSDVSEILYGNIETNQIFIAMRRTRAYEHNEYPSHVLKTMPNPNIVLGLVEVSKSEFENSFNGKVCYLNNDLSFLDINYTSDLQKRYSNEYSSVFRNQTPYRYYVARELENTNSVRYEDGKRVEITKESQLLKALDKKVNSSN